MREKIIYPVIEGLRALVPIMILLNHWSEGSYDRLVPQGQIAIDYFFATEGFLAAATMATGAATPVSYLVGKLRTVYPVYGLALLLGAYMVWVYPVASHYKWSEMAALRALMANALLLPALDAPSPLVTPFNWPTWAILVELYVIALYAGLHMLLANRLRLIVLCGVCAVAYCGMAVRANSPNLGYLAENYWGGLPRCIFGFTIGMLIFRLGTKIRLISIPALTIWIAAVLMMFVTIKYVGLFLLLFGSPIIVLAAGRSRPGPMANKIGMMLGRLSIWIYLTHFPILIAGLVVADKIGLSKQSFSSFWCFTILVVITLTVAAFIEVLRSIHWRPLSRPATD